MPTPTTQRGDTRVSRAVSIAIVAILVTGLLAGTSAATADRDVEATGGTVRSQSPDPPASEGVAVATVGLGNVTDPQEETAETGGGATNGTEPARGSETADARELIDGDRGSTDGRATEAEGERTDDETAHESIDVPAREAESTPSADITAVTTVTDAATRAANGTNSPASVANRTTDSATLTANVANLTADTGTLPVARDSLVDEAAVGLSERDAVADETTGGTSAEVASGRVRVAARTDSPESPNRTAVSGSSTPAAEAAARLEGDAATSDPRSTSADGNHVPVGRDVKVGGAAVLAAAAVRVWTASGAPTGLPWRAIDSLVDGRTRAQSGSRWSRLWRVVVAGYNRTDDPLDHESREALYECILEEPGVYLSALSERADVPLSTARYHLDVLTSECLVTDEKTRGKRRFYPSTGAGESPAILHEEALVTVISTLGECGRLSVTELAAEIDRDPSTVSHHLSRLHEAGLVERRRENHQVMNRLSDAGRTAVSNQPTVEPDRRRDGEK